jgi:hypothetical protein
MALSLYIITALVIFILVLFFIWPRQSLYWLLNSKPLSDSKDRYRQDRILLHYTKKCLHYLHKESKSLRNNPELAEDILEQMKLLLPQKAILAEQRTRLHNIVMLIHKKHMIYYAKQISFPAKGHKIIPPLTNSFNMLAAIKNRLNRLDRAAEEQEKKRECLLQLARNFAVVHHTRQFRTCIKVAKEFQNSNIRLLKAIRRTEKRLSALDRNFNSLRRQR